MALFSSESKEDKRERKTQEILAKYGLEDLTDPRDAETVKGITYGLTGSKLIEFGTTFSGSAEDVAKLSLLRAIVEQNWIIIRQLDKLNNK